LDEARIDNPLFPPLFFFSFPPPAVANALPFLDQGMATSKDKVVEEGWDASISPSPLFFSLSRLLIRAVDGARFI